MSEWGFLQPFNIWLWASIGLFVATVFYFEKKISQLQAEISKSQSRLPRSRVIIPLLLCGLIALSLLRPYLGKETIQIDSGGNADIFLVIDVSISMLAQDASPSRIEFARRKARDIVSALMMRKQESRVGIVLYAGDAYVFCPLTGDFSVISQFLQHIDADLVTARGSSLLRALGVTKRALSDAKSEHAQVVFLGDGEDLKESATELQNAVKDFPAKILFLGIGSEEGVPIPLPQGGYLSANKEIVITKMNSKELSSVFSQSNSSFKKATFFDNDFAEILATKLALAQNSEATIKKSITSYGELGPFILIFVLALIFAFSWRRAPLLSLSLIFIALSSSDLHAQANPLNDSPAYDGYQAYQKGDFAKSFEDFSAALSSNPKNPRLLNSLASSAFKAEKFAEAESIFNEAAKNAVLPEARFNAHYGAGNAALAQKKYQAAIDAYQEALRISPNEARALHNSQIAELLLNEEEKKPKPEKKDEQQQEKDKDQQKQQSSEQKQEDTSSQEKSEEDSAEQTPGQATPKASETKQGQNENSEGGESQNEQPGETPSPAPNDSTAAQSPLASPPANAKSPAESSSSNAEQDQIPLSEKQAQEWLDSLPDTPLLLQRLNKRERINPGDQFW
jgi:Ca-activated chloride channel family protein